MSDPLLDALNALRRTLDTRLRPLEEQFSGEEAAVNLPDDDGEEWVMGDDDSLTTLTVLAAPHEPYTRRTVHAALDWNEAEHPRDEQGRFVEKGSGGSDGGFSVRHSEQETHEPERVPRSPSTWTPIQPRDRERRERVLKMREDGIAAVKQLAALPVRKPAETFEQLPEDLQRKVRERYYDNNVAERLADVTRVLKRDQDIVRVLKEPDKETRDTMLSAVWMASAFEFQLDVKASSGFSREQRALWQKLRDLVSGYNAITDRYGLQREAQKEPDEATVTVGRDGTLKIGTVEERAAWRETVLAEYVTRATIVWEKFPDRVLQHSAFHGGLGADDPQIVFGFEDGDPEDLEALWPPFLHDAYTQVTKGASAAEKRQFKEDLNAAVRATLKESGERLPWIVRHRASQSDYTVPGETHWKPLTLPAGVDRQHLKEKAGTIIAREWADLSSTAQVRYAQEAFPGETTIEFKPPADIELFNDSNRAYAETRDFARSLVERRAHQLLGGEVKSDTIVSDTINALWRDWKNKSDGALGTALRQSCERIFGANNRPSERVGQEQVDRALLLLPIGTLATSEDVFQRGVFPEVARAAFDAIVRAQWEVTQYLLDEANMRDQYIPLYRAQWEPTERVQSTAKQGVDVTFRVGEPAEHTVAYKALVNAEQEQNGAASWTEDITVANQWGGIGDTTAKSRVILRALVPPEAVLSMPVYGQNVHSEHEWVIMGVPFPYWDAWEDKAPSFDRVSPFEIQRTQKRSKNGERLFRFEPGERAKGSLRVQIRASATAGPLTLTWDEPFLHPGRDDDDDEIQAARGDNLRSCPRVPKGGNGHPGACEGDGESAPRAKPYERDKKPLRVPDGYNRPRNKRYNPRLTIKDVGPARRAYHNKMPPKRLKNTLSKYDTGRLGERLAIAWLQQHGYVDAHPMSTTKNNEASDVIHDHDVIEVKAGLVSNAVDSRRWRVTFSTSAKEKEMFKRMTKEQVKAYNARKQRAALRRKEKLVQMIGKKMGKPIKGETLAFIIDPDRRVADIYRIPGFHQRLGWNTSRNYYVTSISFEGDLL